MFFDDDSSCTELSKEEPSEFSHLSAMLWCRFFPTPTNIQNGLNALGNAERHMLTETLRKQLNLQTDAEVGERVFNVTPVTFSNWKRCAFSSNLNLLNDSSV